MRAIKFAFLLLLLAFGATVETAWSVRNRLDMGPAGCRVIRGRFNGPSFTFDTEERRSVPAGARIEVENAFGGVRVLQGTAGEVRVSLRKVVFLPTGEKAAEFASRVRLNADLAGSALRVTTNRLDLERQSPEVGFETHLELAVPPATAVRVRNEHGRLDVADVAEADLTNSFDSLRLERASGSARLVAGHGEVSVSGVGGNLRLQSRHGPVVVEDVQGSVEVETQHGDVTVRRVGGLVARTEHGDLTAETVRGDLEVRSDHVRVQATDVSGRAVVQTRFQDVRLRKVGGDAKVTVAHGGIEAEDVKGGLAAQASFADIALTNIGGLVEATTQHGGLRAQGLARGARVKVEGDEAVLDGVAGPVEVQAVRGGVRIAPSGPLVDPVAVTATHGAIHLDVPSGSRFDLDAATRHGEIAVDVPGLSIALSSSTHVQGRLGGGGSLVKLLTDRGDVRVSAAMAAAAAR